MSDERMDGSLNGKKKTVLTEQEEKVISILRGIKYGEVKIVMQDGIPVRVDEIRKSIKI